MKNLLRKLKFIQFEGKSASEGSWRNRGKSLMSSLETGALEDKVELAGRSGIQACPAHGVRLQREVVEKSVES